MGKRLYQEQRGKHRTALALKNKQEIFNWFVSHPNGTQKACAIELGMSRQTVHNHLKKLQEN